MEAQKESRPKSLIAIYPRFYPSTESLTQNIRKGGGFPKTVTHCRGHCGQVESHTFGKPQSDVPCIRTDVFCAIPRNSRGISKSSKPLIWHFSYGADSHLWKALEWLNAMPSEAVSVIIHQLDQVTHITSSSSRPTELAKLGRGKTNA